MRTLKYCGKGQLQVDWDKALYNEAIGEPGTVSTVGLTDSGSKSLGTNITEAEATVLEEEEI